MNYTLMTTLNGAAMSAEFVTIEAAMEAAIGWVEAQAETRLCGDLRMRWARARSWWVGQGGTMEIHGTDGTSSSASWSTPWARRTFSARALGWRSAR